MNCKDMNSTLAIRWNFHTDIATYNAIQGEIDVGVCMFYFQTYENVT